MCGFSWLLFPLEGLRFQSHSGDQPLLQHMVAPQGWYLVSHCLSRQWMPGASPSDGGTQQRLHPLLVHVGGEECQEHPWPSCCCLLKTQLSSEQGVGVVGHPVHGLKHGAEAVLGSRWRLQTAQPACILLASCRIPCLLLGQSQAAASCWGGPLAAPSHCWWVRMLGVLVEKAEINFKKASKPIYPLMRGDERQGDTLVLRPLQMGLNRHQLLLSCLLPKGSNPQDVGVCSCQPRGSAGSRHPPHRPSAPASSSPNPAQAAAATPRWGIWDAAGLDDPCSPNPQTPCCAQPSSQLVPFTSPWDRSFGGSLGPCVASPCQGLIPQTPHSPVILSGNEADTGQL